MLFKIIFKKPRGDETVALAIVLTAAAAIAALDQLFKYFILESVAQTGPVKVIGDLLSFVYVENRGVAFGMFQNHIWVFAALTIVLIGVFVWLIVSKKLTGKLFLVSAMLMIGGGLGNLIDRIFRGFVVDYLSLSFFPPVCNFADYCITLGAVMFVAVLLFQGGKKEKQSLAEGTESVDPAEEEASPAELSADENVESSADGNTDEPKDKKPDGETDGD